MTDTTAFLWGAATAPHQIEGNNSNSDWWVFEQYLPNFATSGDCVDSYHRYEDDMRLLADAGLTTYRFGIEWSRIEPLPGAFSRAELAHYRRMIDTAFTLGLTPVVTLHHFVSPLWFVQEGGWLGPTALDRFTAYVRQVCTILDGVEWVCTINEPNMFALIMSIVDAVGPALTPEAAESIDTPTIQTVGGAALPAPTPETTARLIEAHHSAREIVRQLTGAKVGWTVANLALYPVEGGETRFLEERRIREDVFLEAARGDDFIGVQAYSTQGVDADGLVPHASNPNNTLTGAPYAPEALGIAVRHAAAMTGGVPVVVTENGIATSDDEQRIAYTAEALRHLRAAMDEGVDVRGYLHWSLLDNFEWGHWEPTFGLVAVDRTTFERLPKPSLAWLGSVARNGGLPD